jgi:thiol-disulfide isomerase/thioredoxin
MYKIKIILIISLLFSFPSLGVEKTSNETIKTQKAHPFTLVTTKRRYNSLKKIRNANKNKNIFLIFFTTTCKYCSKERAKIIEMAKKYDNIQPVFIAVRNPADETITEFNTSLNQIIKNESITYDVYMDLYSAVAKFYNVKEGSSITVPKLFIIDSDSANIIKTISGYEDNLEEIYKNLDKKNKNE